MSCRAAPVGSSSTVTSSPVDPVITMLPVGQLGVAPDVAAPAVVAGVLLGSATPVPAGATGATGAGATSVALSRWVVSARTAADAPMAAVNAITR